MHGGCAKALEGLRILVVEDEVLVAMMLKDMLQSLGCRVDVAPSIETALASIRNRPVDGVLLDGNVHGRDLAGRMTGVFVPAARARQRERALPPDAGLG